MRSDGSAVNDASLLERFGSVYKRSDSPRQVRKAALNEESGTAGGYTLPPAMSLALLKSLVERSFVYPRALRVDMDTRVVQAPIFDLGTVTNQSPFVGGMTWKWGSEPAPTETDPVFASVDLTSWDLIGYTRVSNQVLEDAGPDAERLYVELFAMAAGFQAEYAFFQGTGSSNQMPLGMINAPCAVKVARNTASQIKLVDVETMAGHLLPSGWANAVWAVNPSAIPQLGQLTGFVPNAWHYHERGACGFLNSRPVFPTEKLPALGGLGDLVLFDPSLYVVGTRTEVLVDASPHSRFANYQTEFLVILRIDGKPLMNNSVTLADGSTTASMVVVLQ